MSSFNRSKIVMKARNSLHNKSKKRNLQNIGICEQVDTTLMAESEELKSFFMKVKSFIKVKEESKNVGLKLNIQKTKITPSGPTTSWLQSPSAVILEPRKVKTATVSTVSPSICHEVMGLDAMMLVF